MSVSDLLDKIAEINLRFAVEIALVVSGIKPGDNKPKAVFKKKDQILLSDYLNSFEQLGLLKRIWSLESQFAIYNPLLLTTKEVNAYSKKLVRSAGVFYGFPPCCVSAYNEGTKAGFDYLPLLEHGQCDPDCKLSIELSEKYRQAILKIKPEWNYLINYPLNMVKLSQKISSDLIKEKKDLKSRYFLSGRKDKITITGKTIFGGRFIEEVPVDAKVINLCCEALVEIDLTPLNQCKELQRLELTNNHLVELDLRLLQSCENLEEISLIGNRLSHLILAPFPNLKNIYLSINKLFAIDLTPLEFCPQLQLIELAYNPLSMIDLNPLRHCVRLENIYLAHNRLSTIDLNPLRHCMQLECVYLAYNQLSTLDITPLSLCKKLSFIGVRENPLMTQSGIFQWHIVFTSHKDSEYKAKPGFFLMLPNIAENSRHEWLNDSQFLVFEKVFEVLLEDFGSIGKKVQFVVHEKRDVVEKSQRLVEISSKQHTTGFIKRLGGLIKREHRYLISVEELEGSS